MPVLAQRLQRGEKIADLVVMLPKLRQHPNQPSPGDMLPGIATNASDPDSLKSARGHWRPTRVDRFAVPGGVRANGQPVHVSAHG
jgi:hypothetical protein